jgi:hypothetical protein
MRYSALVCCLFLAPARLPAQPRSAAAAPGYQQLPLTQLHVPALKDSNATQFLAADNKGHLYLLRGDTLEVFGSGERSFDRRVGKLACKLSSATAYAAALDPAGSTWAVASSTEVALCDFEKERRPPGLDWVVSSLGYSRSGPLVVVASLGPPPDVGTGYFKTKDPRVFGIVDDRWQPLVWAPIADYTDLKAMPANPLAQGKAESDASNCIGRKDAIWLASWNSYRLQKVSSSSVKPEREVIVGSGEIEWQKLDKQQREREAHLRRAQDIDLVQGPPTDAVPRGVIRALLCGRDGALYLVVSTADGLALDRFDPAQNVLERVLLDGATVSSGPMTAAFASDQLGAEQLWLGGRLAADGLWRISSDDLAAAHWKPVKDARIDGRP